MTVLIAGIAAVVAAVLNGIWNVGGSSAVQRRTLKAELEILEDMPDGAQKDALTQLALNRAARYVQREAKPRITLPSKLRVAVLSVFTLLALAGGETLFMLWASDETPFAALYPSFVLAGVGGLGLGALLLDLGRYAWIHTTNIRTHRRATRATAPAAATTTPAPPAVLVTPEMEKPTADNGRVVTLSTTPTAETR